MKGFSLFVEFIGESVGFHGMASYLQLCKYIGNTVMVSAVATRGNTDFSLEDLTMLRLYAPVYELYDLIEKHGVYSNERRNMLENEIRSILSSMAERGLYNDKDLTCDEICHHIEISNSCKNLLKRLGK